MHYHVSPLLMSAIVVSIAASAVAVFLLLWRKHALGKRAREFSLVVDGLRDTAIFMLDTAGRVMTWNRGAERLTGYRQDEIIGEHFGRFYSTNDRLAKAPQHALDDAISKGAYSGVCWRYRKDRSRFSAYVTIEPIYGKNGGLRGFAKMTRDVTDFTDMRRHLNAALDNMQQGLLLFDADGRLSVHNRRLAEFFGLAEDPLIEGMAVKEAAQALLDSSKIADKQDASVRVHALIDELYAGVGEGSAVFEFDDGPVLALSLCMLDDGGSVLTFADITERYRASKRLEHLAKHDSLTGLPNRYTFDRLLAARLDEAREQGERLLVAVLDLDGFKEINDTFGHESGDIALRQVARQVEQALDGRGAVARFGGDEFAAFVALPPDMSEEDVAEELAEAFCYSDMFGNHPVSCSGSVGVALFPTDGHSKGELIANADLAMYRAKKDPTQRWYRFQAAMDEEARERRNLQSDLRLALDRHELELVYQVQCSVATGAVVGYEALLRWQHPERGYIPPDKFIGLAEQCGLILPIGEWVLRKACREAVDWPLPHKVAVNISPVHLVQESLPDLITEILLETGLPARRLEIEITETALISDKLRALHNLRRIKALGVSVSLDDFGIGYSSLDTLKSFAFDKIKIDRSFLMGDRTEQNHTIIRAVIGLGHSLGLPVLAEGVEDAADFELLRAENCDSAQGYYLGRPGREIKSTPSVGSTCELPDQKRSA